MFALLGNIQFEITSSPKELTETHNGHFAKHNTLSGKPQLQATGLDIIEREMVIQLHYSLGSVEKRFNELMAALTDQKPLPLLIGNSRFQGYFVIETLTSQILLSDSYGNPLAREVRLSLKEVVKPVQDTQGLAILQGFLPPVLSQSFDKLKNFGNTALDTVKDGIAVARKVQNTVETVKTTCDTIKSFKDNPLGALEALPSTLSGISSSVDNLTGGSFTTVVSGLKVIGETVSEASEVASGVMNAVDEVKQFESDLKTAIKENNVDGVTNLILNNDITVNNLSTIVDKMAKPLSALTQKAITRLDLGSSV